MEEQLLPLADLKPAYERGVWLYVYRDFSGSDDDRAAERVCLRLGMTSYPQHFLVDPETLATLADTGRQVGSFLAAFERARIPGGRTVATAESLRAADDRAAALEKSRSVAEARRALDDPDVLVRFRALEILAEREPARLVPRAEELLAVPNDPFRFLVCSALGRAARPEAAGALESTVREPKDSRNPNVLRIRAVEALATSGRAASVECIAPHASSGDFRNGLTRTAVEALAAIAGRDRAARGPAREALVASYPAPPADEASERPCLALAKSVHAALEEITGRKVPFPSNYDGKAVERLRKAW